MKMKKRVLTGLAAVLCLLLAGLFTGCADSSGTTTGSAAASSAGSSETKIVSAVSTENDPAEQAVEAGSEDAGSEDVTAESVQEAVDAEDGTSEYVQYYFRNENLLNQHYEKHGIEMGFDSAEEYEQAASDVINNPDALSKTEAEDGDYVYYVEDTNEFVILSKDGYIRTYFLPNAGISYYNRQ